MSDVMLLTRKHNAVLALIALGFLLAACSSETPQPTPEIQASASPYVAPLFREFYERMGGEDTLGPVISPLLEEGDVQRQYTEAVLMVFDPRAPAARRFQLASLGVDLGVVEPTLPAPDTRDPQYVRGHFVLDEFFTKYQELGGLRTLGRPLTEIHYDPDTTRKQQFFENAGLYRLDSDPPGTVRLLAYGAWACGTGCTAQPDQNAIVEPLPPLVAPFADYVYSLGLDFTGFALTPPGFSDDGKVEQVFENIVLMIDFENPSQVQVRPMLERIGRMPDPPVARSTDANMHFHAVQGELGYNIPRVIMDYLGRHGGMEVSGPPISEFQPFNGSTYRQCFTNLCVERLENRLIRLAPLGATYQSMHPPSAQASQPIQLAPTLPSEVQAPAPIAPTTQVVEPSTGQPAPEVSNPEPDPIDASTPLAPAGGTVTEVEGPVGEHAASSEVAVQVWSAFPSIGPNQQQEIGASVIEDGQPGQDIPLELFVTMPDGSTWTTAMPLTGPVGQTRTSLPLIQAPNGTLVPFRVCILRENSLRFCVRDNFLIWNTN